MSGEWPPEWEEDPAEADQLDQAAEERLSEVTAYLASVPAPVLPDAVAARISAALAAEAATRAGGSGQAKDPSPDDAGPSGGAVAGGARSLGPAPGRARVRRHRGQGAAGGRRGVRSRPLMAAGAVLACLVFTGVGYGLSRGGTSTTPRSAAASAASGAPARGSAAAGPEVPAAAASAGKASVLSFGVAASGTKYQAATLVAQVRAEIAVSSGMATAAPSSALRGCVTQLTGGESPKLVDRATYQGGPAYVIASSSRVWVVGLGCTAASPELIVSESLAG